MKKTVLSLTSIFAFVSAVFFTSCIGEGTNKSTAAGYFTVGQASTGFVLYQDYGGVVYPDAAFNTALNNNKVKAGDRLYVAYQFTDDNIKNETGKGSYVTNAELVSGTPLVTYNIFSEQEAEAITTADSVFTVPSLSADNIGIYRGFITVQYTGKYSRVKYCSKCKKSFADDDTANKCPTCSQDIVVTGLVPTLNFVYKSPEESGSNTLVFELYYNQHSDKKTQSQSSSDSFVATYPISRLLGIYGASKENINVIFNVNGKPVAQKKITSDDFKLGNYLYFE